MVEKNPLERRAAARRALSAARPPSLAISFVAPNRDAENNLLPPKPCDSFRATIVGSNVSLLRRTGESLDDFRKRVLDELKPSRPQLLILWPVESEA